MKEVLKQWLRSYGITKSHLNFPQYYVPYLFGRGKAFVPQSLTLELTFRCNLSCQMCPLHLPRLMHDGADRKLVQERRSVELTTTEIHGVINDIASLGVKNITLTGGEVFLREDILEVIGHIQKTPMRLCVNTNGWFMRPERARALVDLGVDSVSISVDGPGPTHDRIRRRPGSFERITAGIASLATAKQMRGAVRPLIGITCTLSALNQHNFSEVVDSLKHLGVTSIDFECMFYTTQKAVDRTRAMVPLPYRPKEEDQVLPEELRKVDPDAFMAQLERAEAKGREYGVPVSFVPPFKTKEAIRHRFEEPDHTFVDRCFYPWKSARINPYGDVYSCSIDVDFGNVREAPFSKIWNGEAYRTFRKTLKAHRIFPKCTKCCALNNAFWNYLPVV